MLSDQVTAPDPYAVELVRGVAAHTAELDELIARLARGWTLERMPTLDLVVLRVACFELAHRPDVPTRRGPVRGRRPGRSVRHRRLVQVRQRRPGRRRRRAPAGPLRRTGVVTDLPGRRVPANEGLVPPGSRPWYGPGLTVKGVPRGPYGQKGPCRWQNASDA